jgi:hypothetical protein
MRTAGPWLLRPLGALGAAVLMTAFATASCDDDDDVDAEDYALDYYYYPVDLAVADPYWVDDYYIGGPYYYSQAGAEPQVYTGGRGGTTGTGGAGGTTVAAIRANTPANALLALARGGAVCPGQATIVPQMGARPCGGQGRIGATVTFNACELEGGGVLNGTYSVTSNQTASDTRCNGTTSKTVTWTSTLTDLTYTTTGGSRLVIPAQTTMGSFTRALQGDPAAISLITNGRLTTFDSNDVVINDRTYSGNRNVNFTREGTSSSYTVDGMLSVQNVADGRSAAIAGAGLQRTDQCCRPTGGTLSVTNDDGTVESWTFGPTCGEATRDGQTVDLPDCP